VRRWSKVAERMTKEKEIRGYIMRGKKDGENQDQIQLHIMLCVPGVHACRGVYAWMLSQGDRLKGMLPISMLPPPSPATLSLFLSFSPPPPVSARLKLCRADTHSLSLWLCTCVCNPFRQQLQQVRRFPVHGARSGG
jgi:hypothetical protein